MQHFTHIDLGTGFGMIGSLAAEAIETAEKMDCKVSFNFNSVKVNVTKHSDYVDVGNKALEAVQKGINSVYGKGY